MSPEPSETASGCRPFDIYLVGVGGQGVLTIAEIIAEAAVAAGVPVNYYPSKGMAQRGGFVKAQVRLGRDVVGPNIPEHGAELAIALERSEALKAIRFCKPEGEFVLYDDVWAPAAVMLGKASYPTSEQVQVQIRHAVAHLVYAAPRQLPLYDGKMVPDNVFVLGLVLGHTRLREIFSPVAVGELLRNRWPKAAARNVFAYQAGLQAETPVHTIADAREPVPAARPRATGT